MTTLRKIRGNWSPALKSRRLMFARRGCGAPTTLRSTGVGKRIFGRAELGGETLRGTKVVELQGDREGEQADLSIGASALDG